MSEFISCGTYSQGTRPIQKSSHISKDMNKSMTQQLELEKQIMNNEYLSILKDPKFKDLNVNFMDQWIIL